MTIHRFPHRAATACIVASLAALSGAAMARDQLIGGAAMSVDTISSCVDDHTLAFRPADRRARLDAIDSANVSAALTRRYPIVERDGLTPQAIVLWQKPGGAWLFIALLQNPSKPADVCFTATFVADRFELTAPLIVKYFGAAVAAD